MILRLYDKGLIESFLRKNAALHLYEIGDLDDFFWPHTVWYASRAGEAIDAIALLYTGSAVPTLLAFSEEPATMSELVRSVLHLLPDRFHAHFSHGVEDALENEYRIESRITRLKMHLGDSSAILQRDTSKSARLSPSDLIEIRALLAKCYPENWFEDRMLATGQYFGIWTDGALVSMAGVHVCSEEYGVAALGNIATHPSHRRNGFASFVTAALCKSLLRRIGHIGLNVKEDDPAAVSCYEKLGFKPVARYGEFMAIRKGRDAETGITPKACGAAFCTAREEGRIPFCGRASRRPLRPLDRTMSRCIS